MPVKPMTESKTRSQESDEAKRAAVGGMKKGGKVKKYAAGGLAAGHKSADGIASKGKTKAKQITMKKGGMCK